MARSRPNILWVSFEDTNPFYGCYGDPVARTPHVDRLAAEGCRWPNAFSTAGVCAPARSAIITGMYPISMGTHHMRTTHANSFTDGMATPYSAVIPHYVKCFTEYLRADGYYCTNNAKTDYQFTPPFTAWDELSNEAHWRNRPDPDQPFFAVFNPTKTHESGMWEKAGDPDPAFDPEAIPLPPYFPDTPKVRTAMARMYSNISWCDNVLGELLAQLEEDGLLEDTIIMHWSDHGPMPRGKRWPYDSGIRIPMIVRWPAGLEAGSVSEQLVSTVDLGPTVLSLAGVPVPTHMQGQAFLGDQAAPPREYVYAARDRHDVAYDMVRAARDSRFKYMRNCRPEVPYQIWIPYLNQHPIQQEWYRLYLEGKLEGDEDIMFRKRPPEELYDTKADPWETRNLAADPAYANELARMRQSLDEFLDDVGDLGKENELDMKNRWYPNGEQPTTKAPIAVPITIEQPPGEPVTEATTLKGPAMVQLYCSTQGASTGYTTDTGDDPHWQIYTDFVRLPVGTTTIRAKSIRVGYKESDEISVTFTVTD